jgi:hypothetical protein
LITRRTTCNSTSLPSLSSEQSSSPVSLSIRLILQCIAAGPSHVGLCWLWPASCWQSFLLSYCGQIRCYRGTFDPSPRSHPVLLLCPETAAQKWNETSWPMSIPQCRPFTCTARTHYRARCLTVANTPSTRPNAQGLIHRCAAPRRRPTR